jgi:hypothetical protein
MYVSLRVKHPLFVADFDATQIFSTDLKKMVKCKISWKSAHWEPSCSMRTDGQIDLTKLIVAFRNITNAPKTVLCVRVLQKALFFFTMPRLRRKNSLNLFSPNISYSCSAFPFLVLICISL